MRYFAGFHDILVSQPTFTVGMMLETKYLQDIGDRIGCPVFKNGNRFLIPLAIIKKIEGENIDDAA